MSFAVTAVVAATAAVVGTGYQIHAGSMAAKS